MRRYPWDPDDSRPAPSFSSLPQREQDAINTRLEITLAELRRAKPRNETARARPAASETQRKEGVSHG